MRKAFSKNLARLTLIALVTSALSGSPAFAGYSDDADCAAVSNGARTGAQRANDAIDQAAQTTGAAVEQAKACVDTLVSAGARTISDFGGGFQIPDSIRQKLAQQGCKVLSAVQTRIADGVKQGAGQAVSQLPGFAQPIAGRTVANGIEQGSTAGTAAVQNQINAQSGGFSVATPQGTPAPTPSVFQRLANIF